MLGILAEEEPLTLTEIAGRVQRTPGSTRDYLWLARGCGPGVRPAEAVRLRRSAAARVGAPQLRGAPLPTGDRTLDEVQRYAVARLSAGSVTPR
ncbi:MAG: hypothetical protein MZW92_53645 [Comamonadaceae bacterium]|nr:hypothetical protein [Comamonadaceae bacterium]